MIDVLWLYGVMIELDGEGPAKLHHGNYDLQHGQTPTLTPHLVPWSISDGKVVIAMSGIGCRILGIIYKGLAYLFVTPMSVVNGTFTVIVPAQQMGVPIQAWVQ